MSPLLWIRQSGPNQPLYSPFSSPSVAAGAEVVDRSSLAALTFLIWDILITTDDEVKYIWPRSWTYTKYIYFFVRYIPMLVQIPLLLVGTELSPPFHFSPHACFIWGVYQGAAAVAVLLVVDSVLILRVLALYHNSSAIKRVLACGYMLEIVGLTISFALAAPGISYDNLCLITEVPRTLLIYGASSVSFQFLLFGLTLYKFILAVRAGWGDVPLVVLLVRDGTWAFFVLALVYLAQVTAYSLHNHAYVGVFYSWLLTALSVCGYRILINLNRFSERTTYSTRGNRPRPETNTNIQFTTDIGFGEGEEHSSYAYCDSESYELGLARSSRGRTIDTSQISTLSLGK